ncbi:MAG: hypothetical protein AAGI88_05680 [Pseudomonadota bacterium]
MDDLVDAISTRIRNPLLGAFALSFLALNWQPIFFVLFDRSPVLDRFAYFDSETDVWTLLWQPLAISALLIVASPFISYAIKFLTAAPSHWQDVLQIKNEAKATSIRNELLAAGREKLKLDEEEAIRQAKTDAELSRLETVSDEQRASLQREIENLRSNFEERLRSQESDRAKFASNVKAPTPPSEGDLQVLGMFIEADTVNAEEIANRLGQSKQRAQHQLDRLMEGGFITDYIARSGATRYKTTAAGRAVMADNKMI